MRHMVSHHSEENHQNFKVRNSAINQLALQSHDIHPILCYQHCQCLKCLVFSPLFAVFFTIHERYPKDTLHSLSASPIFAYFSAAITMASVRRLLMTQQMRRMTSSTAS